MRTRKDLLGPANCGVWCSGMSGGWSTPCKIPLLPCSLALVSHHHQLPSRLQPQCSCEHTLPRRYAASCPLPPAVHVQLVQLEPAALP